MPTKKRRIDQEGQNESGFEGDCSEAEEEEEEKEEERKKEEKEEEMEEEELVVEEVENKENFGGE